LHNISINIHPKTCMHPQIHYQQEISRSYLSSTTVNGVCVKDSINKFEADTVEKFPTEHGFVDDLLECRADRVLDFVEVGNTMGGIHEVLSKNQILDTLFLSQPKSSKVDVTLLCCLSILPCSIAHEFFSKMLWGEIQLVVFIRRFSQANHRRFTPDISQNPTTGGDTVNSTSSPNVSRSFPRATSIWSSPAIFSVSENNLKAWVRFSILLP